MEDVPPAVMCPGYYVAGGNIPCGAYLSVTADTCWNCGTFFAGGQLWTHYTRETA